MWFRVDRPERQMGFFDNMMARPITQTDWQHYQIDGFIHPDAEKIYVGLLVYSGKAVFDDVTLEVTGEFPPVQEEPARPMTDPGLANLTAFTRLYGIVRHFHPSDESGNADWNRFVIDGVRRVEAAGTPGELAALLQRTFEPVAPSVMVYAGADPPLPLSGGPQVVRWHNKGFDTGRPNNLYRRTREITAGTSRTQNDIYRIDLGRGVKALVPLVVFADAAGKTVPRAAAPAEAGQPVPAGFYSGNDRATRIAGVAIAWNVFRHFYPYFDVVKTDWDAVLPWALREAASDRNGREFQTTLQRIVAELHDGHGRVGYNGGMAMGRIDAMAEWIDGKYIVTNAKNELKPGDEIVAINGTPALQVLTDAEKLISAATPQWKRSRSIVEALMGPLDQVCTLTIRPPGASAASEIKLPYAPMRSSMPSDSRPAEVATELEPGIWYFDLTRGQDKDFDAVLPKLATAEGIVFDMRGYPRVSPGWFQYVTKSPMRSAQWHVPLVDRPGKMVFEREGEWNITPKEPYLNAKKIFLTNGGAISYAESTMGIVENYKLGEIVGEATAGTNGNVDPFDLPGGYSLTWTGMKVLKHDGTQHHGVGIAPTVPVHRTQAGVAAGRDEVLERGMALLKQ
jgi:C-terminal processing protease CtpA/Prc